MKKLSLWGLGAVFAVSGALGWVANPLVGADGFFETNHVHDLLHLVTGVGLMLMALLLARYARFALFTAGGFYVVLTATGWLMVSGGGELFDYIHVNAADHWLHAGLAASLIGAGFLVGKSAEPLPAAHPPQPLA